MKRRAFISLLGGAAISPLVVHAQQPRPIRRIGVLTSSDENDREAQSQIAAFRQELARLGWMDGRTLAIDIRWTRADVAALTRSATELAALAPDLILTSSTLATATMLQHTRTIPVIFVLVADPVGGHFVESLPRPGGNATGFTPIVGSLGGKWVELLKEFAPRVARITMIFNPASSGSFIDAFTGPFAAAASSLGVEAKTVPVNDMSEVESLISDETGGGLVVLPDAFTVAHRAEIMQLVDHYRIPAVSWSRSFAELGCLIAYGPVLADEYRRAAAYADRILKGEKPAELPVQTPVKFELVVNMKTARAFGLAVPERLRSVADDVIE
jgi:putative ABC transport system substrate-binding protein